MLSHHLVDKRPSEAEVTGFDLRTSKRPSRTECDTKVLREKELLIVKDAFIEETQDVVLQTWVPRLLLLNERT